MSERMEQKISYRESHKHKGADYHRTFEEMPHRRMVWQLEKGVLVKIIDRFFSGSKPDHLDFASGTGRVLAHLSEYVNSSTAVDISDSMLGVAKTHMPDARFLLGDITREDLLKTDTFDLITAFRFFPNAEEELRMEVLAELVHRLKPQGFLVFNNHINSRSLLHRLSAIRRGVTHDKGMTDDDVVELTQGAGLKIVTRYPIAIAPLSERRMRFPRAAYWLERLLMEIPGISGIAKNVIYVCRRQEL